MEGQNSDCGLRSQVLDQLLGTDLVMEWIFTFLSPESLLTCRKVSRLFLHHANQVLRHRRSDALKITLKYHKGPSPLSYIASVNGIYRSVSDLARLMEFSSNFPCRNFHFNCCLGLDDIQEFLNCHGHKITHLQLYVYFQLATDESLISTLRNLLVHQGFFIETLVLVQSHNNTDTPPHISALRLFPPRCPLYRDVTLAHLKKLVLKTQVMDSVVKGIVGAAPNLQRVTYIQHPSLFIQLNRLYVLKEFLWELLLGDDGLRAPKIIEWHQCFTESNFPEPFLSVKSIEFGSLSCCPQGWLDQFSRVCPNVESIEINNFMTHFPEAAPDLWKFEHLKRLNIIIHAQDPAITSDYAIDAAFTGFSEDTCRELFSEGLRGMSCEDLELCRVRPSILDIKALSRLEVTFVTNAGDRATVWRVMTKVTFLYALDKCPNITEIAINAAGESQEHAMAVVESLESTSTFVPIHVQVMTKRDWWPEHYDKALIMT